MFCAPAAFPSPPPTSFPTPFSSQKAKALVESALVPDPPWPLLRGSTAKRPVPQPPPTMQSTLRPLPPFWPSFWSLSATEIWRDPRAYQSQVQTEGTIDFVPRRIGARRLSGRIRTDLGPGRAPDGGGHPGPRVGPGPGTPLRRGKAGTGRRARSRFRTGRGGGRAGTGA